MSSFGNFFRGSHANPADVRTSSGAQLTVVKSHEPARPTVWTIGGGKGGVGKSFITTNMATMLAQQGSRVLVIDADLGAANIHTFFGMEGSSLSFSSFLKSEVREIRSLISKTPVPNLDLISGAKDSLDVADIGQEGIDRLRDSLTMLDYGHVLLDIGPGTNSNMLDIFLMANEGILVTTPDPTSIENTYRFLKCVFLRRIKNIVNSHEDTLLKKRLQAIFRDNWSQKIKTVADILTRLKETDPERGMILKTFMDKTSVSLIINQSKLESDKAIGRSMKKICSDYFGIDIGYLGNIGYDDIVSQSIRQKRPLAVNAPASQMVKELGACLQAVTGRRVYLEKEASF